MSDIRQGRRQMPSMSDPSVLLIPGPLLPLHFMSIFFGNLFVTGVEIIKFPKLEHANWQAELLMNYKSE